MNRFCGCCILVLCLATPAWVYAQSDDKEEKGGGGKKADEKEPSADPGADPGPETPKPETPDTPTTKAPTAPEPSADAKPRSSEDSWKDIVVIPRKPFLKRMRVELAPIGASSINDNLIQHTAIGGEFNFFVTDILSIGLLGLYYFPNVLDQEFRTRYHFGLVPSLNKYKFTATLNMAYVPIYGKFSLFNRWIMHYELFVTGGVGVTGTEVIPRDYDLEPFSNLALTFPIGIGGRVFLTRWLSLHLCFRDFMMLDKFEPDGRSAKPNLRSPDAAKEEAKTRFVNNVMFTFGVGIFFPLDFKYTTFR